MTLEALDGLEACAAVVAHAVDRVALLGGEGARRFEHAFASLGDARAVCLRERGAEAASAAVGAALAGARVAFVLSGREAVSLALPALRALASHERPALVVLPAHGDERGRAVPEGPYDDLALLFEAPVGVLVAAGVREVCDVTLAACALASRSAMPWCVTFELALVGCAVGAVDRPSVDEVSAWWSDAGVDVRTPWFTRVDLAWGWISARRPWVVPVDGRAVAGDDLWVRAGVGDFDARGATVTLTQVRPFPSESVAALCHGADRVNVCEPLPDALGDWERTTGRLTVWVRAALSRSRQRVSQLGGAHLADLAHGTARVLLAWNEPARGAITRALVRFAAGLGWRVRAEMHEPWVSSLVVEIPDAETMSPHDVIVAEPDALGLSSVLRGVDDDELEVRPGAVVLLGPCAPARLDEIRQACAAVGAVLHHEPEGSLAV